MKKKIIVQLRRKREGKTNYPKRLRLLQSRKPRLVIRPTLTKIIVQIVIYQPDGDKVVVACDSTSLKKLGWNVPSGNIPAAYLTGLLAGKKAKKAGLSEAVLDTGLYTPIKGSRIYAALRGVVDAGISVPHDKDILPSQERLFGKHITSEDITLVVKKKIEELS